MRAIVFGGALIVVIHSAAAAQARPSRDVITPKVDSLIERLLSSSHSPPAVSVAVVRGRDTLVMRGWGLANRESNIPATDTTSYRIGSVTKQFTASLTLRLIDQRRLALSDSIKRFVRDLPAAWGQVTVLHLLNHTSGIPDVLDAEWRRQWADSVPSRASFARSVGKPLSFSPGTRAEYSNTNYKLLGVLIEAVSGQSFAAMLERELAAPLGLSHTRYCEDAAGTSGQARGYVVADRKVTLAPYQHISQPFSAGGVCSTVRDMARWNAALHTGRVLSSESYQQMVAPQGAASSLRYGFGLFVEPSLAGTPALLHNGGIPGFQATNAWFPAESLSVTVLTNAQNVKTLDLVMRDLASIALGQPVPLGAPRLDDRTLRRYVGRYVVQIPGRPLSIRVWIEDDGLIAQPDGQAALPLRAVGEDTFDTPANMSVRFRFIVEGGTVTKGVLEQRGRTFDMSKDR